MSQGKFNTLTPDHQTGYTIVGITNMRIICPSPKPVLFIKYQDHSLIRSPTPTQKHIIKLPPTFCQPQSIASAARYLDSGERLRIDVAIAARSLPLDPSHLLGNHLTRCNSGDPRYSYSVFQASRGTQRSQANTQRLLATIFTTRGSSLRVFESTSLLGHRILWSMKI
ncbi:hypothetical protein BofuT4_P016850.1 [Botrytis cinerea T4]|uniref:Uncharacterized protein n=1 Tax=Botryotinia fuckeliana (strain T4) TaxID=999810 RepID=G2YI42_BOTF4|nr:hypothetical protein BofuT4_P016850.1 [Botrytis cinerea T4]